MSAFVVNYWSGMKGGGGRRGEKESASKNTTWSYNYNAWKRVCHVTTYYLISNTVIHHVLILMETFSPNQVISIRRCNFVSRKISIGIYTKKTHTHTHTHVDQNYSASDYSAKEEFDSSTLKNVLSAIQQSPPILVRAMEKMPSFFLLFRNNEYRLEIVIK